MVSDEMDIKSKEERSLNMSKIRSKDTKPEVFLRKKLFALGYRYRLYRKDLPGKPDLYLPKYRTVIFVHGCFWHRHEGCHLAYIPKTNTEFWEKKFSSNVERDQRQYKELEQRKLRILIVWECTIRKMKKDSESCQEILDRISGFLKESNQQFLEI